VKGLSASIYRNDEFGDCSNRGPSVVRQKQVLVIDDEIGAPHDFDPERHFPVKLVRRQIGENEYVHARPFFCEEWPNTRFGDGVHTMFGGCFIFTSDSRLRDTCSYPIPLHDRVED
jgi:hypothetical protein